MNKFKDNFSSESFYPDSNYYLDQDNAPKEDLITEDQKSNTSLQGLHCFQIVSKESASTTE